MFSNYFIQLYSHKMLVCICPYPHDIPINIPIIAYDLYMYSYLLNTNTWYILWLWCEYDSHFGVDGTCTFFAKKHTHTHTKLSSEHVEHIHNPYSISRILKRGLSWNGAFSSKPCLMTRGGTSHSDPIHIPRYPITIPMIYSKLFLKPWINSWL